MKKESEFCQCKNVTSVHTETDDFKQWDVCNTCGKVLEDSIEYFNQCDEDC